MKGILKKKLNYGDNILKKKKIESNFKIKIRLYFEEYKLHWCPVSDNKTISHITFQSNQLIKRQTIHYLLENNFIPSQLKKQLHQLPCT